MSLFKRIFSGYTLTRVSVSVRSNPQNLQLKGLSVEELLKTLLEETFAIVAETKNSVPRQIALLGHE